MRAPMWLLLLLALAPGAGLASPDDGARTASVVGPTLVEPTTAERSEPTLVPVQETFEVEQDGDPGDVMSQIFKGIGKMFLTAATTCSGLSFCTAGCFGFMGAAGLGYYGVAGKSYELMILAGFTTVVSLLLVGTAVLVILPIGLTLRYFGLWDPWTERLIIELWSIFMYAF